MPHGACVVAAVCIYFIAYRFYCSSPRARLTSMRRAEPLPGGHDDGLDYVPTHRAVLRGHLFAAIAGAGPPVGPLLATRRDGRSLSDMIRGEMGPIAGTIAGIGILLICVIVL